MFSSEVSIETMEMSKFFQVLGFLILHVSGNDGSLLGNFFISAVFSYRKPAKKYVGQALGQGLWFY